MADTYENDTINVLRDGEEEGGQYSNIVSYIEDRFERAKDARYHDESRWLQAYRNYRGIYGPDVQFTETEKSRVFIKVTKTKVLAAYGQLIDVLFSQNKFPISVDPTTLPEGVAEAVNVDPAAQQAEEQFNSLYGFPGDEMDFGPGETTESLEQKLGPLEDKLADVKGLEEGVGATPSSITFEPAMVAAKKMEKKIKDQLEESAATRHLRFSCFECVTFGTGIMKGPFAFDKEYSNWGDDGEYNPIMKTVPQVEYTSIWNFYPDPDAYSMYDCDYVVERHRMTRSQMRYLKKRPYFRSTAIEEAIKYGPDYTREWWENDLDDNQTAEGNAAYSGTDIERFEVLEFWGTIDAQIARDNNLEIPDDYKDEDAVQINCWVCNGEVLRLVINPFTPKRIPYFATPYEVNPYSFFGVGLAENMDDTQTLMNGFMRLAVDNAVLSGNLLIEVDESNLTPGQDLTVYPGKVFRRQGGAPGQAIFDKARVLADESSGLPSYAYGQTGVMGTGRTASGISMLMGAASGSIRTVIKNFDDYLLRPLGEAMFAFNMQFDFDPELKGDLEVKARGTESFMQNEVRSQRLISFLQIVSNPTLAPFAKFPYIMREIAATMDLDVDKITNNPDEAMRQALVMQQMQQQAMAEQDPAAVGQDPMGTGGGTIGTGQAPVPGEQGAPTGGGDRGQPQQQQQLPPELLQALQQVGG